MTKGQPASRLVQVPKARVGLSGLVPVLGRDATQQSPGATARSLQHSHGGPACPAPEFLARLAPQLLSLKFGGIHKAAVFGWIDLAVHDVSFRCDGDEATLGKG
jgi:hypothetical protein